MKSSLSFDVILGALALLAIDSAACSKRVSEAAPEPANAAQPGAPVPPPPSPSPLAATAAPTPAAEPAPQDSDEAKRPSASASNVVDAGREVSPAKNSRTKKGASAACGATGCSPDMKKNNNQ